MFYYEFVAAQRSNRNSKPKESRTAIIFWLVFIIVIVSVFILNAETIQKNFNLFRTRLSPSNGVAEEPSRVEPPAINEEPAISVVIEPPAAPGTQTPATANEPAGSQAPQSTPGTQGQNPQNNPAENPAAQNPQTGTQPPQTGVQTPDPAMQTRVVYFTQVDSNGQIHQARVTRRLPASSTPMQDALNAMLTGPTSEEISRGIINLVPQNTKILSATIRENTAVLSFSEDFMFNTFGVEGYIAQMQQVIWTVTEFQNVHDVQILIEGSRHDYIGEGIYIGSPVNRQSY